MDIHSLVPELWRRYPFLDDESLRVRLGGIKEEDVAGWSRDHQLTRSEVYDAIARHLALGFHKGDLPFAFCDAVLSDLHGVITMADDERPDLFWNVFQAFDEGEYYHNDNREVDPVETYTRPMIAEIVAGLAP